MIIGSPTGPVPFVNGGAQVASFTARANYGYQIMLPSSGTGLTCTLPAAPPEGTMVSLTRQDGANTTPCTVAAAVGDSIENSMSSFALKGGTIWLIYFGGQWYVLSRGWDQLALSADPTPLAVAQALAQRDTDGTLQAATPTLAAHLATKGYVDSNMVAKSTDTWHAATLQNSWTNNGGSNFAAAYMKDALGWVRVRGTIATGVVSSTLPFLTLPAGYRPTNNHWFSCPSGGGNHIQCLVDSTGKVYAYGGTLNSYLGISAITFQAEQ